MPITSRITKRNTVITEATMVEITTNRKNTIIALVETMVEITTTSNRKNTIIALVETITTNSRKNTIIALVETITTSSNNSNTRNLLTTHNHSALCKIMCKPRLLITRNHNASRHRLKTVSNSTRTTTIRCNTRRSPCNLLTTACTQATLM